MDLLKDEVVQEKIGEVARFFYTNDTVTINLYYAAAAVLLGFNDIKKAMIDDWMPIKKSIYPKTKKETFPS